MVKFKKTLSLLLASLMLASSATIAASAAEAGSEETVGAYNNQTYLENYASAAYNEKNLGSTYSPSQTVFKTWSPDATDVKVKVYKTGSDGESGSGVVGTYNMTKNTSTGIWSYTLTGDHKNEYYTYIVTCKGKTNETQDVYSKAVGVNGNRSMIVDLDSTDPEGWSSDKHVVFQNAGEAVVWEVHVRDFSIHKNSGVSAENKGTYLAFAEGGTTLNGKAGDISTCADYLVEAGVNCVQLQPVYDFGSVDESIASSSTNRNWGYDPENYNAPEGSYSSNPYDGNVRIKEFKQMVQALHDRGISVVMDVVYNHTFSTSSCFEKTVPGYYYRMSGSSTFSNGSGCGNETASDKLMFRKFMIDSTEYWANEYHIDGFRFDLMGLHDVKTMNEIRSNLDSKVTNGTKILMYGEPWTGGTTPNPDPIYSWQGTGISRLDARVGAFGDQYRDAIKGDTDSTGKGFVQGNTSTNIGNIVLGVQGQPYKATAPKGPAQAVCYADAHDNLILWDKIVKSNGSSSYMSTTASYQNQVKEVMTLLMTSQGIPFMTAGSDFGRTKQGDHNSYNSSDSINAIDWNRVKTLPGLAAYYKGMLQIRKYYSPLHSSSIVKPSFQSNYGDVVAYTYANSKSGEWNKLAVLVNGGSQSHNITLSGSNWTIVASTDKGAGIKSLGTVSGNSVSVPAKGSMVLVDSASFGNLKVTESFGQLTINHVDENGKVLLTQTAKYRAGNTYRAIPDSNILYDNDLVKTEGATSGIVEANGNYTVTFTYRNSGVGSGYVTANFVDQNGKALKDPVSTRYKVGMEYSAVPSEIQGYQLDMTKFPGKTQGTFSGDLTLNFVYKPLDNTSTIVHYKKPSSWSTVRCYAYYTEGSIIKTPNGEWNKAGVMTSEGNGWYKSTINVPMTRVMFHNGNGTSNTAQEPPQGADGYLASGEVWIENSATTFKTKIITSHVDLETGAKLANDVVVNTDKVTEAGTYTTQPLSGRTDVIVPGNAKGNYAPGIINVVYLYGTKGEQPTDPTVKPTEAPTEATQQPTEATQPSTEATQKPTDATQQPTQQPTTPGEHRYILIGDADLNGKVNVSDATVIQMIAAELVEPTDDQKIAADTDGNGIVTVADATLVQMYSADFEDGIGNTGKYVEIGGTTPVEPTQKPDQPTDPIVEPTDPTGEVTEPVVDPTEPIVDPTQPIDPGTFKFTDNQKWGTVYVYGFNDDGPVGAEFPGTECTESEVNGYEETVFTITIPEGATAIVISDGQAEGGQQTVDITEFNVTGYYTKAGDTDELGHFNVYSWDSVPVDDPTDPTDPIVTDGSFKFTDNQKWGAVYVYGFNGDGTVGAEFPGTPCTEEGTNDFGEMVYLVNIPEGATSVVISDGKAEGGQQTVDISDFSVVGYYTKAGDVDAKGHFNVYPWVAGPDPIDPPVSEGSFKFTDNQKWGSVYVYGFNGDGTVGAEFPGTPCTEDGINDFGEMVYIVNIPEGATSVVISDGKTEGGQQTIDISDFSVVGYYTKAGDVDATGHFNVYPWEMGPDPVGTSNILFTNNAGWSNCFLYAFNESGDVGAAWPGAALTETTTNGYNETQYVIHIPAGATGIVLSNGTDQTADINDFGVSGYYTDGSRDGNGHLNVLTW